MIFKAYTKLARNTNSGFITKTHASAEKVLLDQGIIAIESRDCWFDIYAVTFKLAVNIALADNNQAACDDYLARGQQIVVTRKLWRLEMLLNVLAQKVALHFNDIELFNELNNKNIREKYWLEEYYLWKTKEEYHAIQAIYFLHKNISSKTLFHTEKLLKVCMDGGQTLEIAKAKIIQALAYSSTDNDNKAFKVLHEACQYCTRYKIKQVFYEVPTSIEYLLIKFKKYSVDLLTVLEAKFISDIINGFKKHSQSDFGSLGLSHREQQLVPLLMQGHSNKQMASVLGISDNTVKFHLKNLFAKVNVNNRNEAAIYFIKADG